MKPFNWVTRILLASVLGSICAAYSNAATIFTPISGNLTASIFVNGSGAVAGADIRGASVLGVTVNGAAKNNITLADITGGTDPLAMVLPFGNNNLNAIGAGGLSGGSNGTVTFDLAHPAFLNNFSVVVFAADAAPQAGSANSDAGIMALIDSSPLYFGFGYSDTINLGTAGVLDQYTLLAVESIPTPVPEPSYMLLVAGGVCSLFAIRFFKRKTA